METTLTRRDKKELNFLEKIYSTTPDQAKKRNAFIDAIKRGEAERTGTSALKICQNTYDEKGTLIKRRRIGFLQRETGRMAGGEKFYFSRGYKINGIFHQLESLFGLTNSSREYTYLETNNLSH